MTIKSTQTCCDWVAADDGSDDGGGAFEEEDRLEKDGARGEALGSWDCGLAKVVD